MAALKSIILNLCVLERLKLQYHLPLPEGRLLRLRQMTAPRGVREVASFLGDNATEVV